MEGIHTELLRHIIGKRVRQFRDGTWETPGGGRRVGGSGNAVGNDLHRETAGNLGTVSGAKTTI